MRDIKLTWTIPTVDTVGAALALGDVLSWNILRDGVQIDNMLRTTAGPGVTYTDTNVPEGDYEYTVETITTGPLVSPISNVAQETVPSGVAAAVSDLTAALQ